MERPEEGRCRKSRKSMPQVKGLKELRLPVRQQQKKAAVRDNYGLHPDGTSWLPDFFIAS